MRLDDGLGNWVELHIVGYQFPDFDWRRDVWDANWLIIEGGAALDGRRWNFRDPSLTTSEASDLANWLDQAADGQAKEEANFTEPNLAFGPLTDRPGIYVKLGNESRPPWIEDLDGTEVNLAVTGNQLSSAAAAIRSELLGFPWRGRRKAARTVRIRSSPWRTLIEQTNWSGLQRPVAGRRRDDKRELKER